MRSQRHRDGLDDYLDRHVPATPILVIDLQRIAERFAALRRAMPEAAIRYAVKANPDPEVLRLLASLGSGFDVASPLEIELCLRQGAAPETISYGNTIKKPADIALAHAEGIRMFTTDSEGDVAHLATHAPGAQLCLRLLVPSPGARTPFGRKFGVAPELASDLVLRAAELGLRPRGLSFHVGSQHTDPTAWEAGIAVASTVFRELAQRGVALDTINLGGGFGVRYREAVPELSEYAAALRRALARGFPARTPRLMIEPGRIVVADAGVIRSEVVAVSRRFPDDPRRWVYLDVGRYNGLAETENEAITYRLRTRHDGGPTGPVVLAGPTCDGDDVLYQRTPYELPLALRPGDHVDILSAGAYTASYSSVGFNGFPPLASRCIGSQQIVGR
ncbi:MAG: type III PLP-dependent enzyme [Sciscionella sp.]